MVKLAQECMRGELWKEQFDLVLLIHVRDVKSALTMEELVMMGLLEGGKRCARVGSSFSRLVFEEQRKNFVDV